MLPRRLRRLPGCTYLGPRVYFVTILTKARRRFFAEDRLAVVCKEQVLRAAKKRGFAIRAGTLMPDHTHLLVRGLTGDADFCSFMKMAKQLSGFYVKQLTGRTLWTDGYFERVVRHDEDLSRFVDYILLNPVKARLAASLGQHPHTWENQ
jgi:putative transposase